MKWQIYVIVYRGKGGEREIRALVAISQFFSFFFTIYKAIVCDWPTNRFRWLKGMCMHTQQPSRAVSWFFFFSLWPYRNSSLDTDLVQKQWMMKQNKHSHDSPPPLPKIKIKIKDKQINVPQSCTIFRTHFHSHFHWHKFLNYSHARYQKNGEIDTHKQRAQKIIRIQNESYTFVSFFILISLSRKRCGWSVSQKGTDIFIFQFQLRNTISSTLKRRRIF